MQYWFCFDCRELLLQVPDRRDCLEQSEILPLVLDKIAELSDRVTQP